MFEYSEFSKKLSQGAGISELMKDLGRGLAQARHEGLELSLMGGGNPAHIPEVEAVFRRIWNEIGQEPDCLHQVLGDYSDPQGDEKTREELASWLSKELNSEIHKENILFTNGSQSAFFLLFNSFAGNYTKGRFRKILLPITPEYIGYSDQGILDNMFTSLPPRVEYTSQQEFVYLPDMDRIHKRLLTRDIGAVCMSRPTNPSGNVVPWKFMEDIRVLCEQYSIPFIIDNAYGYPFPNILFHESEIRWNDSMIHVLSLSKMGLPGLRTGIILARREVVSLLSEITAVQNLATGNVGPMILRRLLVDNTLKFICENYIQTYYKNKSKECQDAIKQSFHKKGIRYEIHESHGALFLWIRFPNHRLKSQDIYREAKNRGLFLIAGDWFFPGLEENFSHRNECIRLTYSRNISEVIRGIEILSDILSE